MAMASGQQYHRQMILRFAFVTLLPILAVAEDSASWPGYVLELPEGVTTVLIAETDTSSLHRFSVQDHGLEPEGTVYMSVGQNGVGKERAWDRRTPLGIYFINDRLDTSRMHEKYGPLALPLDYPNVWDRVSERSGDGIWIHGVTPGSGRRPALDTDGCIALPNAELLELAAYVELYSTPVVITRRIKRIDPKSRDGLRAELRAQLDAWAASFRDGNWQTYLALYASEFEYRGLNREQWSAYRVQSSATRPLRDYRIDDIALLADPEAEGLFLSRFRQTIESEQGSIVTTKRLYWRRAEDGMFRIVAEDNG